MMSSLAGVIAFLHVSRGRHYRISFLCSVLEAIAHRIPTYIIIVHLYTVV